MRSQAAATAAAAAAASLTPDASAGPRPVAFNASDWLGVDGNWSTYGFSIGNNNLVKVLFSTSISEFWAVGPGGCQKDDPHCATARGGIYNPSDSKQWSGLGTWQLGLPDLGTGGSGQYGFDTIAASSPITNTAFSMSNVLISAVTSTDYFLGYFGVGLRAGNFGDIVALPPLRQAVTSFGWIPSYSYGYTAGASYRGVVGSATLGGYDSARFAPHDTTFTLNQTEAIPRTLIRGIEVSAQNGSWPAGWASATQVLLDYGQAFSAVIDTSTPYLWLPSSVCDSFAKALNLTYNSTFGLYTLTNDQYLQYSSNNTNNLPSFTFSLSSTDNHDNFGYPLNTPGVVNITLPLRSFVSLLEYPFMNATIPYGAPAVPYFTLRKATDDTFIIGNAFMQEAYLITQYDSGTFSVHQARFPGDPIGGAQIQTIKQPPNSPLPPPLDPNAGKGLTAGEMAGIAIGATALLSVLVFAFLWYRRRKRQQRDKARDELDFVKDTNSTLNDDSVRSSVSRNLSRLVGRRRSRRLGTASTAQETYPSEAPDCEIYELPAAGPPAELEAGDGDEGSDLGDTDLGTGAQLSAYEAERRRLDRQLQGPVPAYSPPADDSLLPSEKKSPPDEPTPEQTQSGQTQTAPRLPPISLVRPQGDDGASNTILISEPSPVSPHDDWGSLDPPSPVTASTYARSHSSGTRSRGHSNASRSMSLRSHAPGPTDTDPVPAIPGTFQRTPIDHSRVVCLGPLPENAQLPGQSDTPVSGSRKAGSDEPPTGLFRAGSGASEESLGSNFTEEQTDNVSEKGRFDPDRDLVHVPQVAERRYSWE